MWIPYGHRDIRTFSFAGTVRSHASTVRACEYPYDQWYRALRAPVRAAKYMLAIYLPSQTRLCDICPVRAWTTTNWPSSMGTKSLIAHV